MTSPPDADHHALEPAPQNFHHLRDTTEYPAASGTAERARRAFVNAMGVLGAHLILEYDRGNRHLLCNLAAEEDNFLAAWRLARTHGWWSEVISPVRSLWALYENTGRRAEWRRLVEAVVPDFVDLETDGPFPGREQDWDLINEYRVRLAMDERRWLDAERLQRTAIVRAREHARPALAAAPETLDDAQRDYIHSLSVSIELLGHIQLARDEAAGVDAFKEALSFYQQIGATIEQRNIAISLGNAYLECTSLSKFHEAERWYQHSLALTDSGDANFRAKIFGQLGGIALRRVQDATRAGWRVEDVSN